MREDVETKDIKDILIKKVGNWAHNVGALQDAV